MPAIATACRRYNRQRCRPPGASETAKEAGPPAGAGPSYTDDSPSCGGGGAYKCVDPSGNSGGECEGDGGEEVEGMGPSNSDERHSFDMIATFLTTNGTATSSCTS